MKTTQSIAGLALLARLVNAFPANMMDHMARNPDIQGRANEILHEARSNPGSENGDAPALPETFSEKQLIDVTGEHAWVAPGPNDIRGPCPGLNAFANHGYLPHSGFGTIADFIDVTTNVVGMGPLFANFLAIYGAVIDGSGLGWSIGGTPPSNLNLASLGLGLGNGLSGSHNKYEGDASPTRPDLYQSGNNYKSQVDKFQELVDLAEDPDNANFNLPLITDFRGARHSEQVATNPYFFNAPFSGVIVSPAAFSFIYRFMANHSAEAPYGTLNLNVLKSWFGYTGNSGNFTYHEGYERIPDNWYRRDFLQPYELDYFGLDILYMGAKYPELLDIGGNTNGPNTFTGIDLENFTGGIVNAQNFLQGNNLACVAYQFAAEAQPDALLAATTQLLGVIGNVSSHLGCPKLQQLDQSQLQTFPGYTYTA